MTTAHPTDHPPGAPPKSSGGLNLRTVVTAVKRHPLVLAGLILVAASAATAVYTFLPLPKKAAAVVYHIADTQPTLINPGSGPGISVYKPLQAALLTSHKTMAKVLADPKVRNLAMVPPGTTPGDLSGYVTIEMRGNTEFMRFVVEGDSDVELIELAGAINRAYLQATFERENAGRILKRAALEKEFREAQATVKDVHAKIDDIARKLGSKDAFALGLMDRFRQEALAGALNKLAPIQDDLNIARKNLSEAKVFFRDKARQPAIAAAVGAPWLATVPRRELFTPAQVDEALARDPTLLDAAKIVESAQIKLAETKKTFNAATPFGAQKIQEAEKIHQDALEQQAKVRPVRRAEIEKAFGELAAADENNLVGRLEAEVAKQAAAVDQASKKVEDLQKELADRSRYRLDLDNFTREIALKEQIAARLATDLETMRIEGNAPQRVSVSEEPYVVQGIEGNRRLKFSLIAAIGLFGLGFGTLIFIEYRGRRVTHVDDATTGLGARLVGTIPPLVPSSPGAASSDAHAILVESIDTARNILMHGTPGAADARVLLVTSAVSGEGKTTLSGHLAISLTRAGFRTLLVDGDIHAPSAHLLFNLPDAPGLSEVLRGEVPIATAVRPSPVSGLSVLPAGKWTLATRQALVGERWRHLAHELKAQFDFVVVDTSPLLLVSDTMLLAREADAVVLSVMMGVSQVSRVADTIHRLGAVGAELAGVVVSNVKSEVYDYGYAYRSKYPAAPNTPAALPGAALATAGDAAKE